MSRSNQTTIANPSVRWMEWNGEKGNLKFYDKDLEQRVDVDPNQTFILLDQLAVIKGWNDASDSGVYSNEVRDVTKNPFVVKAFKGGLIASGLYREIKDKIAANGGHFTASVYIGLKIENQLQIANLQLKGAALNAWIEFCKKNRANIYKKAICITGVEEGTKGRVVFKVPVFGLKELSEDTNNQAIALDIDLQNFLKAYLEKPTPEQAEQIETRSQSEPPTPTEEPAQVNSEDDPPF